MNSAGYSQRSEAFARSMSCLSTLPEGLVTAALWAVCGDTAEWFVAGARAAVGEARVQPGGQKDGTVQKANTFI